jgi:hypothetical protein
MAYYYRALPTTAAGGLITLLDEILVLNANWSIWDAAAGTNCKVYKCATTGSVFYLYADDNQVDYTKIRIYEAWDAGAHTGSGTNTSATPVVFRKMGLTLFILNDTRLIYAHVGTQAVYNFIYYAGQLRRFVDTINSPILIGTITGGVGSISPVGLGGVYTSTYWKICRFDTAIVRDAYCVGTAAQLYSNYMKADRRWYIQENIVYQSTENLVIGQLDGVVALGMSAQLSGISQEKIITVNGVQWIGWYDGTNGGYLRLD